MAKNFRELEAQLPPEVREQAKQRTRLALAEMLHMEIRKVMRTVDPQAFANDPVMQSQIDTYDDLPLSSLYGIVKQLGGELEIVARLPNETITFPPLKQSAEDAA